MKCLRVSGELESLEQISSYVITAGQNANLDKKTIYKLRLAVDEIATNIVIHGYEEAGIQGDIVCQAELNENTLSIYLEDTGAEYDPTQQEKPDDLSKPLEERHLGGLGIYLAINGVDKYIYKRLFHRNVNIFIVNLK